MYRTLFVFLKLVLLGFCSLFSSLTLWAQNSSAALFEGPTYADVHRTINERHKFLGPYEFQEGSIYFDGIWQEGIEIN